jgi:RNA polymerase sigma-70 factor (ECF subfamily)
MAVTLDFAKILQHGPGGCNRKRRRSELNRRDKDLEPNAEPRLRMLMLKSLEGDQGAYRSLLAELSARLRVYFARRLGDSSGNVEDLVQEVLIAVHRSRDTYDRSLPFTAWAYALARYKLVDHYRRTGRRAETGLEAADEALFPDGFEAEEARHDLRKLLEDLPEKQRDLVIQVKIEGLSIAEAAERAGMSVAAAKVSLHRSLKRLGAKVKP